MIKESALKKKISVVFLFIVLAILLVSFFRTYKVYEPAANEFGIKTFYKINERQMTRDATFHGVELRNGTLYTTYDRLADTGKHPCPT